MQITIHIDGGARGNPGPAATGVVIQSVDPACTLHEAGYFLGRATNNVAEYQGLIRGLELAVELGATDASIFSDSELMVRQVMGRYRVKSPDLKPLFEKVQRLLPRLNRWRIGHVYREENKRADELVNMAIDAKRDVVVASASDFSRKGPRPAAGEPPR
jgi:ribonuclease HI